MPQSDQSAESHLEAATENRRLYPPISIVVPCFNSAVFLAETTAELHQVLVKNFEKFEVILVDDGSEDDTFVTISSIVREFPNIVGLQLGANSGQHGALLAGTFRASHEVIVTVDDDGQNPAEEIPRLVAAMIKSDSDVIYGVTETKAQSKGRRIFGTTFRMLASQLSGNSRIKTQSNFRVFKASLLPSAALTNGMRVSLDAFLLSSTIRVQSIEVSHHKTKNLKSRYRMADLISHAGDFGASLSTRSLLIASLLGLALFVLAVILGIVVMIWAFGDPERQPGFASLTILILGTSAVNLLVMGNLGFFLRKVFEASSPRPRFVIRQYTESQPRPGD